MRSVLQNCVATIAELAQQLQCGGYESAGKYSEEHNPGQWPCDKKGRKEATSVQEKTSKQTEFLQDVHRGTAGYCCQIIVFHQLFFVIWYTLKIICFLERELHPGACICATS
ncbi:hypothetical protein XENOCAPTIV_005927 [Xenoophorus captivus]|uniref:Uncharacterized protein n=1 Tax=Xenoophorus captivus TaxID=1517983 RepID=A0ABV0RXC0_9TELE